MKREDVYYLLDQERIYQESKWGHKDWSDRVPGLAPDTKKLTVLAEEFGEVAKAILENNRENLIEELVDLGATCVAWLESFDVDNEVELINDFDYELNDHHDLNKIFIGNN